MKLGQPVVLVGRVAVRERPDDRREADDQSLSFWQDGIGLLEQTKNKEGIGVAIEDRIEPCAEVAFEPLQAGDLALAAVDDRCDLRDHAAGRRTGRDQNPSAIFWRSSGRNSVTR